jgi:hypothetical protein
MIGPYKLKPYLRADETLTALTTEAAGIFGALTFRTTSRTNGKHMTIAQWELLREQWAAIEIIAKHAKAACERAVEEGTCRP